MSSLVDYEGCPYCGHDWLVVEVSTFGGSRSATLQCADCGRDPRDYRDPDDVYGHSLLTGSFDRLSHLRSMFEEQDSMLDDPRGCDE